jgi:glycosyltransferase involved in cell wall biosynthesis
MPQCQYLKIALVHDFLLYYGGAEKVLEALTEMFPEAPIYTLLYDKERMRGKFQGKDIRTSFLQKFPRFLRKHHKWLLPFYSTASETFNLRDFDLVISSSSAWSKGIITKLNTVHIAYIHSPMRFVWDYNEKYLKDQRKEKLKFLARPFLSYLRIWDRLAADRPDYLIANSRYTQERLKKYYRRDSVVIYPPAFAGVIAIPPGREKQSLSNTVGESKDGIAAAAPLPRNDKNSYFLIVSRLSRYKKVDLAVEAFNKLGLPLVVIGEGSDKKHLEKIAGKNIKILGWQKKEELNKYYQNARAFIFPSVDDFGITVVEAMSYGVPVIALQRGGVMESVEEGITGLFFRSQVPEILADAVRRFIEKEPSFERENIKKRAEDFSKEKFKRELAEYINSVISKLEFQMPNQIQNPNE